MYVIYFVSLNSISEKELVDSNGDFGTDSKIFNNFARVNGIEI
jgi:hypothetical protein